MKEQIRQFCMDLGFDAVGITTAEPVEAAHVDYFQQWLADGHAGEMSYMHRNIEKRFDPAKLLAGAKSVVCVALNYRPQCGRSILLRNGPPAVNAPKLEASATLRIANFAQYQDYHPFIKDRLFQLAEFIQNAANDNRIRFKACVDSVPIAERALARRAGLGFIGRNHMLIHPELGNQILLGELITTLVLEPDEPMENLSCGDCGHCIRACPTGALGFDGSFDARKCISYLTIEKRDSEDVIPASEPGSRALPSGCRIKSGMTNRRVGCAHADYYIFGCDECILACPHELGKPFCTNNDFQHHPEWQELTSDQIQSMTEEQFRTTFANSGLLRPGLERLKRNVAEASSFGK